MPHRPERPAAAGADVAVASPAYNGHHLPGGPAAEAVRGHTVAHIMRPNPSGTYTNPGYYHPSGIVTPISKGNPNRWIASNGLARAMPSLDSPTKSSDSADRSTGTKHDDSTVGTLNTEEASDELEATASALLLVSSQCVKLEAKEETEKLEDKDSDSVSTGSVPLKKRKSFLRPKSTDDTVANDADPCHVSPGSQSSHGAVRVGGRTVSKEESTPERSITSNTVRSNSYDSKESSTYHSTTSTQALLDSSKIRNATDIAPPSHVSVTHFPSVLHQVLSDEANNGTIVQWLPDGESWKVLRWDALRREVLPRYFADLTDENGEGCGTIDAFLWHLTSWGFEEIKDGSAYRHDLFIRGAQKLCSKMRSSGIPSEEKEKDQQKPNTVSPHRETGMERSMLQVPSLSVISRPSSESSDHSTPNKRARYESWPSRTYDSPSSDPSGWGHFYSEASRIGMRHASGQYSSPTYDPRYQVSQTGQPYSPPQITRSGRGALRLPSSSRSPAQSSQVTSGSPRSSFPVSNRGKGSRKNMISRPSIPSTNAAAGTTQPETMGMAEVKRVSAAQHGVAMAVSRKTKRKLPLAQKTVLKS